MYATEYATETFLRCFYRSNGINHSKYHLTRFYGTNSMWMISPRFWVDYSINCPFWWNFAKCGNNFTSHLSLMTSITKFRSNHLNWRNVHYYFGFLFGYWYFGYLQEPQMSVEHSHMTLVSVTFDWVSAVPKRLRTLDELFSSSKWLFDAWIAYLISLPQH